MPISQTVYSPAKINISLYVLNKRKDNYHNIYSLMLPLTLCDEFIIEYQESQSPRINLQLNQQANSVCLDSFPLDNNNLIAKAYYEFYKNQALPPYTVDITVTKHIPLQAGLGGGSSNAASLLRFLNKLHHNYYSPTALYKIAMKLGADVPFFIDAVPAIAEGIGEKLSPVVLTSPIDFTVWLLKPKTAIQPTPDLFSALKREPDYLHPKMNKTLQEITGTILHFSDLVEHCHNDFEPIIQQLQPEICGLIETFHHAKLFPHLSGTGPTLFLLSQPHQNQLVQDCIAQTSQTMDLWICKSTVLRP